MTSALKRLGEYNIKYYIIALVSGLVTPLGFAPFGFYPIPFITLLLLILISLYSSQKKAFLFGYLFGLGFFGYGVNWLHISINLFGGINLAGAWSITLLLVLYLAIFPALFSVLVSFFAYRKKISFMHLLFIPASWTLLEWVRGWMLTGFPWLNIGYSQIDTLLSGIAPVAGVYGIGFMVVMSSVLLLILFQGTRNSRMVAVTLLITFGMTTWSSQKYEWSGDTNRTINVALIQGAIPQDIKWSPQMRQPTKELYRDMSLPYLGNDLIIWPEAAIPAYYHQEQLYLNEIHNLFRQNNTVLLTGMPMYEGDSGRFYNGAIFFADDIDFYYKQHLVPFGEYLPLKFLLQPIVDALNIPIADFSHGDIEKPVLQSEKFNIGISICYEDTFGNEVIRAIPDADILINISNDAWFGDSLAPHQHLQMARMRAHETGRYLLRATNTGITAIINHKGEILDQSPQFVEAALTGTARLFVGSTPYSRFGNYPVIIFCVLILGFFILQKQIGRT